MGGKRSLCKKNREKNRYKNKNAKDNKPLESKTMKKVQDSIELETIYNPVQSTSIQTEGPKHSRPISAFCDKKVEEKSAVDRNSMNSNYMWSGVIGALVTLAFIITLAFLVPGFRYSSYYVNEDPSLLNELLDSRLSETDSLRVLEAIKDQRDLRKDIIEDLLENHIIVSSEDFASNLSGYYNALIAVLAAMLVIINLFGFFAWRSNAMEALEQERKKLNDAINDIDKSVEKNLEDVLRRNQVVREKLEGIIQGVIDQDDQLSEEEWDKIHLLLKKYKKEEVLKEINADVEENDGSIEEE